MVQNIKKLANGTIEVETISSSKIVLTEKDIDEQRIYFQEQLDQLNHMSDVLKDNGSS